MVTDPEEFYEIIVRAGLYTNARRLRHYLLNVLRQVDFAGKRVVDIGGGVGLLSFEAVRRGASEVVLVEPEADGSTAGVTARFEQVCADLGYRDRIKLAPVYFQDYELEGDAFDVVISMNSVNHLNEEACEALPDDPNARKAYHEIFAQIGRMTSPGARLIFCDCTRSNFFQRIGVTNPFAPSIEWQKHQPPEVWADLFSEATDGAIRSESIHWLPLNVLGTAGRILLDHRRIAYFLNSCFRLELAKAR